VTLVGGKDYPFRIEFYEDFGGESGVDLSVDRGDGNGFQLVPESDFTDCAPDQFDFYVPGHPESPLTLIQGNPPTLLFDLMGFGAIVPPNGYHRIARTVVPSLSGAGTLDSVQVVGLQVIVQTSTGTFVSRDGFIYTRQFSATLSGAEEVPARATPATGSAVFDLNASGTALHYRLDVRDIQNPFAAHIHVGAPGVNGPIVAHLFDGSPGSGPFSGTLSEGTITAADLTGPLAGHPLSDLIAAMVAGDTYTNVHTNDGIDPPNTGAGDFPGGEIRGQNQ